LHPSNGRDGAEEEEGDRAARPDDSLTDHGIRDHGIITRAVFPDQEDNEGRAGSAEQADDGRTVPSELITAILECKEELDRRRREECEADEVEFLPDDREKVAWFILRCVVGDFDKDEKEANEATDGEVDVET